ncbi:MAG: hypothetical protein GQ578_06695 [Desulfuromonadaceae bacterium]|nr:hypothetical protein [Desulfuromonadaceae bacterium]
MKWAKQLKQFNNIPFGHGALLSLLKDYKRPNDKISRMLAEGDILKIKRGLYVLSSEYRTAPVSKPLLANLIYGPSYVSLDFALSYYGLIPEGVFEISSMTPKRVKYYDTPLGRFTYTHSFASLYGIGIVSEASADGSCFLIASPEKALCDKVVFTKKLSATSVKAMRTFLTEDLRIDLEDLTQLDLAIIGQCCDCGYKTRQLNALYQVVEAGA